LKILAVSDDRRCLDDIQRVSSGLDVVTELQTHEGTLAGLRALPAKGEVDVLMLDCRHGDVALLSDFERLSVFYPDLSTILIIEQESPELLLRALRMGVREVLKMPLFAEELAAALRRITQKSSTTGGGNGRVLAFMPCKGGSGASFLATNLGYVLATHNEKKVLLIDLNLQFGDAVLYVSDRRPTISLIDIVRDMQHLDMSLLGSAMVEVTPNFGVISAPEDPSLSVDIRPSHIESLVRFARNNFDYVILDVGRSLDTCTIQALDLADQIYPVLQLTLPFLRDAKRLFEVYRSLDYSAGKIHPVLNRVERTAGDLTVADADRLLAYKTYATLPNHYKSVAASVNQGIPILKLDPISSVSRAIVELAERIDERPPSQPGKGLLARLFARN
jgi:pilus assembly protein CpaE